MTSTPIALILGGGPRIGWSVADKLRSEGYKVAIGSRNPDTQRAADADVLPVSVDVSNPKSVQDAFETVKHKLGVPSVVVYNCKVNPRERQRRPRDPKAITLTFCIAAALSFPSDTSDPFASITPETLQADMVVNVIGGYAALRESVAGFKSLPAEAPKAFIATGNVTPFQPLGMALTLGVGKAALVHAIEIATKVYHGDGSRYVRSRFLLDSHYSPSIVEC
jgi:NAD(P)-dependent dehydrogenase (short-subunit alcohol dehydrogenase family)